MSNKNTADTGVQMIDDMNARRYSPQDWEFRASKRRLFTEAEDGLGYPMTEMEFGFMFLDELVMSSVPQPSASHTEIIHLDGNPLNCRLENMRWGTRVQFLAFNEGRRRMMCSPGDEICVSDLDFHFKSALH